MLYRFLLQCITEVFFFVFFFKNGGSDMFLAVVLHSTLEPSAAPLEFHL